MKLQLTPRLRSLAGFQTIKIANPNNMQAKYARMN